MTTWPNSIRSFVRPRFRHSSADPTAFDQTRGRRIDAGTNRTSIQNGTPLSPAHSRVWQVEIALPGAATIIGGWRALAGRPKHPRLASYAPRVRPSQNINPARAHEPVSRQSRAVDLIAAATEGPGVKLANIRFGCQRSSWAGSPGQISREQAIVAHSSGFRRCSDEAVSISRVRNTEDPVDSRRRSSFGGTLPRSLR